MQRRTFLQLLAALPFLRLLNQLGFARPAQAQALSAESSSAGPGYGQGAYGKAEYPGAGNPPAGNRVYLSFIRR